jgi:hypothetical protein
MTLTRGGLPTGEHGEGWSQSFDKLAELVAEVARA